MCSSFTFTLSAPNGVYCRTAASLPRWPQNPHLVFDFNLAAQAFIRYAFLDYDAALGRPLPTGIAHGLNLGPKLVQVFYPRDDFQSLDVFHRRAIEQSFNKVFCSGLSPHGVAVLG
jgi:hypothetical protein